MTTRKRKSKDKNKNKTSRLAMQEWQVVNVATDKQVNRLSEQIDVELGLRNVGTPRMIEIASRERHIDELCEFAFINEQKRIRRMHPMKEYYL